MSPNNEQNQRFESKPPFDKTFIEGSSPAHGNSSPLVTGVRLNATAINLNNPYTSIGTQTGTGGNVSQLPSGEEQIPLGSGTIHGVLGTGGMARVYKIWNEKLEVYRAVKLLLPNSQSDLRSRFETETKITAKLHHPNIVEIYNVGEWNDLPYLEMEYINGDSLDAIIGKRGKLPADVCAAAAILVARALTYAHGQDFLIYGKNYHGVIHRDLKPANVMISKAGDLKLMDFGIARPTEASLHTVEGNIVGTMQYLSPEQIDGIDIDCRTDIYSLGAILYEMLTGTKTFPQETITNLIKKKVINEYRKFTDFNFSISPALTQITQKCLQVDKTNRYASAQELLNSLETAFKFMSVEEPGSVLKEYLRDPDSYVAPAERKTIRMSTPVVKKLALPLIAGIVLLFVVGGFVVTLMALRTRQDLAVADDIKKPAVTSQTASPAAVSIDTNELKPLVQNTPAQAAVPSPAAPKPASATQATLSLPALAKKYGATDPLAIGRAALNAGKPKEAAFVLETVSGDDKIKYLLLLEAYVESGTMKEAQALSASQKIEDAHFDNLCGRMYTRLGETQTALDYFENALTRPSVVRSNKEIRTDACFYTAQARNDLYTKDQSAGNRLTAVEAWNLVIKLYANTPTHPRFKQAEAALAALK